MTRTEQNFEQALDYRKIAPIEVASGVSHLDRVLGLAALDLSYRNALLRAPFITIFMDNSIPIEVKKILIQAGEEATSLQEFAQRAVKLTDIATGDGHD